MSKTMARHGLLAQLQTTASECAGAAEHLGQRLIKVATARLASASRETGLSSLVSATASALVEPRRLKRRQTRPVFPAVESRSHARAIPAALRAVAQAAATSIVAESGLVPDR